MVGTGLYLAVAIVVAAAILIGAEWLREPGAPAPDHTRVVGLFAGLLWPVLALGVLELSLVAAAALTRRG